MQITKSEVGKNVYFVDRSIGRGVFVIEYGEITGVVPKYNFQDRFAQSYARCVNIMIAVKKTDGSITSKVVNDDALVFEDLKSVLRYCKNAEVVFGYSVLKEE